MERLLTDIRDALPLIPEHADDASEELDPFPFDIADVGTAGDFVLRTREAKSLPRSALMHGLPVDAAVPDAEEELKAHFFDPVLADDAAGFLTDANADEVWREGFDSALFVLPSNPPTHEVRMQEPPLTSDLFMDESTAIRPLDAILPAEEVALPTADPSSVEGSFHRPAVVAGGQEGVVKAGPAAPGDGGRAAYAAGGRETRPFLPASLRRTASSSSRTHDPDPIGTEALSDADRHLLWETQSPGTMPSIPTPTLVDNLPILRPREAAERERFPQETLFVEDASLCAALGLTDSVDESGSQQDFVRPILRCLVGDEADSADPNSDCVWKALTDSRGAVQQTGRREGPSSTSFSSSALGGSAAQGEEAAESDTGRRSWLDALARGHNPKGLLSTAASDSSSHGGVLPRLARSQSDGVGAGTGDAPPASLQDIASAVGKQEDARTAAAAGWWLQWGGPAADGARPLIQQDNDDDIWTTETKDEQPEETAVRDRPSSLQGNRRQPVVLEYEDNAAAPTAKAGDPISPLTEESPDDAAWEAQLQFVIREMGQQASESAESLRRNAPSSTTSSWAIPSNVPDETLQEAEQRRTPAIDYPFRLDRFQREAVYWLEAGHSVFVAAHTSAGKTAVAEYAIALCQRNCSRCIYTSPIKALSNQKFRDFQDRFEDIGIITGDIAINPDASCLVMTTEILRSMLYRGADLIRDIEWVIFDEVHYINDSERGVVWEEVIIMLPEHVGMVFLSATSPNTVEFSDWIGRTKRRPVYVLGTEQRPVPLHHAVYVEKKAFPVMDHASGYQPDGVLQAREHASRSKGGQRGGARGGRARGGGRGGHGSGPGNSRGGPGDKQQWRDLVKYLGDENLLPAVVFSFSKRVCEAVAFGLSGVDLTTSREKHAIHAFLRGAITRLQPTDQQLPQILRTSELLKRGIGVHHGGILPIVKECVEILFTRGLVRVLFATETFAMGVNMPARTVVFNGIRKHDGTQFRDLHPGEYTQMAGRAGRRGIDSVGTVLLACWGDEGSIPDPTRMQHLLQGKAAPLQSQFRLKYSMLLNLLRVEDMSVTDMMRRSFSEFRTQRILAGRDLHSLLARGEARLRELESQASELGCLLRDRPVIEEFYDAATEASRATLLVVHRLLEDSSLRPKVLCPGRVVAAAAPIAAYPRASMPKQADGGDAAPPAMLGIVLQQDRGRMDEAMPVRTGLVPVVPPDHPAALGWVSLLVLWPRGFDIPPTRKPSAAPEGSVESDGEKLASAAPQTTLKRVGKGTDDTMFADLLDSGKGRGNKGKKKGKKSGGKKGGGGMLDLGAANVAVPSGDDDDGVQEEDVRSGWSGRVGERVVSIVRVPWTHLLRVSHWKARGEAASVVGSAVESQLPPPADSSDGGPPAASAMEAAGVLSMLRTKPAARSRGKGRGGGGGSRQGARAALTELVHSLRQYELEMEQQTPSSEHVDGTANQLADAANRTSSLQQQSAPTHAVPLVPLLDPAAEFRLTELEIGEAFREAQQKEELTRSIACAGCPRLADQWALLARRRRLERQLRHLRHHLSNESLQLFPDFQQRLLVLERLGYVLRRDEDSLLQHRGGDGGSEEEEASFGLDAVVSLKGRVTCEINTTDELVLPETIFEGVFEDLEPAEAVALLSAFVCQDKSQMEATLPERLGAARTQTIEIAEAVGKIQMDCGLDCLPNEFARQTLNFALAESVYEWARGTSFAEITQLTDVPEGSIVRTMTRLDSLCREVRDAARVIGDPLLYRKMETASTLIRRDVIFCGSLYVS